MDKKRIVDAVIRIYKQNVEQERFNGVRLEQLCLGMSDDELKSKIRELISLRKIDCLAPPIINPHIMRHPPPDIEIQLDYLDVKERYHTCLYPTPLTTRDCIDLSFLNQKPFSQQLAMPSAQIDPLFFEVQVLDRYRQDPRYQFQFNGYVGTMSLSIPEEQYANVPERDQVFVQTFGLGIDDHENPVVAVFRRYLGLLTPEHQQYWNSFSVNRPAKIHKNYFKTAILGEFYTNDSALAALSEIIKAINAVCVSVWGCALFRINVPSQPHYNLSPFMRPTKADFLNFAHELDKLISENLDKSTIQKMLEDMAVTGDNNANEMGSLALLEKYLFSGEINWNNENEARDKIIKPLRALRKTRQKPAHAVYENMYDLSVYQSRREILSDVTFALWVLLQAFREHPRAPSIAIPAWLEAGDIEFL